MGDDSLRSSVEEAALQDRRKKKTIALTVHGNKLEIQSKIICREFILSSLITASPHGFIWERHWLREAAEETHLPPLPALPQECFSSGPLSPMCRRPLCRVCFACKAGCRCCPKKRPGGTRGDQDTRRPHHHATRLASPCFAATPSAAPASNTSHYFTPSKVPLSIPGLTCHPSIPSPTYPTIPLPPSQHTQLCVSWETCSGWCMEAR